MKKIAVLVMLALSGAAYGQEMPMGVITVNISDIVIDAAATPTVVELDVLLTCPPDQTSTAIQMYYQMDPPSSAATLVNALPQLTPTWNQDNTGPGNYDQGGGIFENKIFSLGDNPQLVDGWICSKLYISVPASLPGAVYQVAAIAFDWADEIYFPEGWPSYYTHAQESWQMIVTDRGVITVVPEPVSALLLGLGGLFLRRRR